MATAFDQQRSASQYAELGFDDRFGLLVDTEWTAREHRRLPDPGRAGDQQVGVIPNPPAGAETQDDLTVQPTRRGEIDIFERRRIAEPGVPQALRGSAQHAIVVLRASWAVVDRRTRLWTVPELWKTHKMRFPQARWTAHNTRRPQRPTGPLVFYERRTNA